MLPCLVIACYQPVETTMVLSLVYSLSTGSVPLVFKETSQKKNMHIYKLTCHFIFRFIYKP